MDAKMRKELMFDTEDAPGQLAKICEACGSAGVNIDAVCAYGKEGKGHFLMCTSDDEKAKEVLGGLGFEAVENNVVVLNIENAPGRMAEVSRKVADAGINLKYIYGSAGAPGQPAIVVLDSDDNAKVVEILQ